MTILYLAAALLFCVAAASLWFALQRPDVIARITALAVSAIASAVLPVLGKRMSPEREAEWRKRQLRGEGDKRH